MKSPLDRLTQPCTVTCPLECFESSWPGLPGMLSCANSKLPASNRSMHHFPAFIEVPSHSIDGNALAPVAPNLRRRTRLLDMSFLIMQFFPFPRALHPEFADVHPGIAQLRGRRKLHGAFVNDQGRISQRNYLESPQRIVEDILGRQFVQSLQLGPFAPTVNFNALIVVRQQFSVGFPVFVLQRLHSTLTLASSMSFRPESAETLLDWRGSPALTGVEDCCARLEEASHTMPAKRKQVRMSSPNVSSQ